MSLYNSINLEERAPIPAGYSLHITTWENDADNYNTTVLWGLSLDDVRFYIAFASQFKSEGRHSQGLGNKEVCNEAEAEALRKALLECKPSDPELLKDIEEYGHADMAYEIIGVWNEGELYRVFDSHRVYFIPQDCPRII